ncbi:hypothetical protein Q5752_007115 [Cryptotrichosporon argae]
MTDLDNDPNSYDWAAIAEDLRRAGNENVLDNLVGHSHQQGNTPDLDDQYGLAVHGNHQGYDPSADAVETIDQVDDDIAQVNTLVSELGTRPEHPFERYLAATSVIACASLGDSDAPERRLYYCLTDKACSAIEKRRFKGEQQVWTEADIAGGSWLELSFRDEEGDDDVEGKEDNDDKGDGEDENEDEHHDEHANLNDNDGFGKPKENIEDEAEARDTVIHFIVMATNIRGSVRVSSHHCIIRIWLSPVVVSK